MPRTIESIMTAHRSAGRQRLLGRPIWEKTINIKSILYQYKNDTSEDITALVANKIAALFRSEVPSWLDWSSDSLDEDLTILIEEMDGLRADSHADDPSFTVLDDLNNMLDQLYDWADVKRVWLGL